MLHSVKDCLRMSVSRLKEITSMRSLLSLLSTSALSSNVPSAKSHSSVDSLTVSSNKSKRTSLRILSDVKPAFLRTSELVNQLAKSMATLILTSSVSFAAQWLSTTLVQTITTVLTITMESVNKKITKTVVARTALSE